MEQPSEELRALNENIIKLTHTMHHVNTYRFYFIRGIVLGVGTFLGASVVAAIVIAIVVKALGMIGMGDYFSGFFPSH